MAYSDLLKDPRWQKKRLEILNRDNWTCRECHNTKKTLHVHHLYYLKNHDPWDYDNKVLITLCEDCHKDCEHYDWQRAFLDLNLTPQQLTQMASWHRYLLHIQSQKLKEQGYDRDVNPSDWFMNPFLDAITEEEMNQYYSGGHVGKETEYYNG